MFMRKLILLVTIIALISITACTSTSETTKKISLEDAPDILNLSLLLPSRFEHLDAVSEGFSKADMGFTSKDPVSEVQLYMSEDPFQVIYGIMLIYESQVERAKFDAMVEDEYQMERMIAESIIEGAGEEGEEITVPNIDITQPVIGDKALLGEGYAESSGFQMGFDVCCFRIQYVYIVIYSVYMSSDKISLIPLSQEIEKRINRYSQ